ncbi:unnamed protein product [Trichobilharzia regenti]|nr:unnamed protein product [Trichobilharzia regenti]
MTLHPIDASISVIQHTIPSLKEIINIPKSLDSPPSSSSKPSSSKPQIPSNPSSESGKIYIIIHKYMYMYVFLCVKLCIYIYLNKTSTDLFLYVILRLTILLEVEHRVSRKSFEVLAAVVLIYLLRDVVARLMSKLPSLLVLLLA